MPQPTPGDVHVNRPLTQISIAFMQRPEAFVADRVFPNIPVNKQADSYFKYDRSDFFRNQMRKRAPATESAGSGWKLATDTYYAHVWALHKDIDDQTRSNADEPLDMDRDTTEWLSLQALINREVNFVTSWLSSGLWTTEVSGDASSPGAGNVLHWSDANSTPITDVKTRLTTVQTLTGLRPNKAVLGRQVWDQISEHPDILDRVKAGGTNDRPAMVSRQAVATLWEVDEILVMDGVQTTSAENPAFETAITNALIGGKHALFVYANQRPSLLSPSGGYTFSWKAFTGAGPQGQRIKRFRIEAIESDRVEIQMAYVQKLVAPDTGVFFADIIA